MDYFGLGLFIILVLIQICCTYELLKFKKTTEMNFHWLTLSFLASIIFPTILTDFGFLGDYQAYIVYTWMIQLILYCSTAIIYYGDECTNFKIR